MIEHIIQGRWIKLTAWDRIKQDDPFEPVPSRFVPDNTSTSTSTTVLQMPATATSTTSSFITAGTNYTGLEMRLYSGVASNNLAGSWDTRASFSDLYGNTPIKEAPRDVPYARNARERRILSALGDKLPATIRRATQTIGKFEDTPEWNHRFFELLARKPPKR